MAGKLDKDTFIGDIREIAANGFVTPIAILDKVPHSLTVAKAAMQHLYERVKALETAVEDSYHRRAEMIQCLIEFFDEISVEVKTARHYVGHQVDEIRKNLDVLNDADES